MRKRRVVVIPSVIVACSVLLLAAGFFLARGGGARITPRPADAIRAKAAGDALVASRDTTVLVVTAHPDDAEWWAGGTIAALAKDNRVILLLGTSGDKGNGGLDPQMGAKREALQLKEAPIIGYADVLFLRHRDGALSSASEYPGQVEEAMRRLRPAAVISFDIEKEGPVYHHEDHRAAGRAALAGARAVGGIDLYLMHTSAPDVIADYGPVSETKREAASIMFSYRDAGPILNWLGSLFGRRSNPMSYGSKQSFPEVGVDFGEVFRRERT